MSKALALEVLAGSPLELDFRWYDEIRDALLRLIVPCGARVLDVGCGRGDVLLGLAGRISFGLGIDLMPSALTSARRSANKLGIRNIDFLQGTACRLPIKKKSFDFILCLGCVLESGSLYHKESQVLREFLRVLRPGGTGAIHVTNWAWEFASAPDWTFFHRGEGGQFLFSRARRTRAGEEMVREYQVLSNTPLYRWLASKRWPGSKYARNSGDVTALSVIEKKPIPPEYLRFRGKSRYRYFTAESLKRALVRAGFQGVLVAPYGQTYDIAWRAGLLKRIKPLSRRLAEAEAETILAQKEGSGTWLFSLARKSGGTRN